MNVTIKTTAFIIILLIVICVDYSYASDGDIISKVVKTFYEKLSTYEKVFLKYAKTIFYWCVVFEIAYLGIKSALGVADIKDILKNFCIVLLAAGFFLAVINNYHEWSWNIINGLKTIAGEATTINDASEQPFKTGLSLATSLFEATSMGSPARAIGYIVAGLVIIFCFALITAQIVLIKCECIVAICAASILVGLGATSFLRDYAINVLKYIVSVAFKLMVLQLVLGVGISFLNELKMAEKMDWAQIGISVGFAIVLLSLVKSLPDVVAGIINGSHVGSGNSLTSTVTALGAGLMGAGMAAGAGVANIGRAAQAAHAEGASGMGLIKGTAGNLWDAARQSAHNQGERRGTVASALRERIEQARLRHS